jgi:glycosyltransferase involved in cell wall biosynthesis
MCFGCPSVAPSVGGIPEVVQDHITGLLVPFGDVEKHVQAVESVIQNSALRKKLGVAAQTRAREHFSAESIVPQYEALYRRVCAQHLFHPRKRQNAG